MRPISKYLQRWGHVTFSGIYEKGGFAKEAFVTLLERYQNGSKNSYIFLSIPGQGVKELMWQGRIIFEPCAKFSKIFRYWSFSLCLITTEAYSEPCRTSEMEVFLAKIVNV